MLMQLSPTYRFEGRISSSKDVEESVCVTQSYNKNKSHLRKVEVVDKDDDKKIVSHIEYYPCKQPDHCRNKCLLLEEAEK